MHYRVRHLILDNTGPVIFVSTHLKFIMVLMFSHIGKNILFSSFI